MLPVGCYDWFSSSWYVIENETDTYRIISVDTTGRNAVDFLAMQGKARQASRFVTESVQRVKEITKLKSTA